MATLTSAQHVFMFLWIIGSVAAGDLEVRAEPGEDVTLQCHSPTGAVVQKLVWSRSELKDVNVFFFRDNKVIETNQDQRYRGRVELKDPQMKNGNASVVLKNVDIDDSGTYQCEVTTSSDSQPMPSINLTVIKDPVEVKAKPGEDVTLQCNGPTDTAFTKIKWDRPGMKGLSVFFFRGNMPYEKYQDPRYHGRVELKDPEVKNGDASLLLKKVTVTDTGTYQCRVTTSSLPGERKLLRSVHLSVSEGPTKEELEEKLKKQSKKLSEAQQSRNVGLGVSLGVGCPLAGVACFTLGRLVFPKPKSVPSPDPSVPQKKKSDDCDVSLVV